jgi:succinyl-CoA synthetase beta subunit
MIGYSLVTKQSGEEGMMCNSLYVVEKLDILSEMYLAFTLDRASSMPVLVYSPEGGMAIEDVAESTPEKIFKSYVDIDTGFTDAQIDEICNNLSLNDHKESTTKTLKNLFKCFVEKDSDMVEINPMVVDRNFGVLCADAKFTIDDNAAFRQQDITAIEDKSDMSENEHIAEKNHLNYIPIGGNIGCLVNGAGLAMATMDILKLYGGHPANFLDVGGGAVGEQMNNAIAMLCDDASVDTIFINIFGGILRCDLLVESIIEANSIKKFTKPIVLRLNGSKSEEAKEILKGKEEALGIQFEADFDKAAQLAVKVTNSLASSK